MSEVKIPKLPKSSKILINALAENSPLTQKQLILKVGMPAKTVRYALKRLSEESVITQIPNLEDMRSVYYALSPDLTSSEIDAHIEAAKEILSKA
jgi:DNA-binding MarR family transcriptional regulator